MKIVDANLNRSHRISLFSNVLVRGRGRDGEFSLGKGEIWGKLEGSLPRLGHYFEIAHSRGSFLGKIEIEK